MTIEAMKQALEALEHEANKGNDNAYRLERDVLRAAIDQAEKQEPCIAVSNGKITIDAKNGNISIGSPRQWVGLTDEEVKHIADSEWEEAFVRLIEAKLKEKNCG